MADSTPKSSDNPEERQLVHTVNSINDLPQELLTLIFSKLHPSSWHTWSQVNKTLRDAALNNKLYQTTVLRRLYFSSPNNIITSPLPFITTTDGKPATQDSPWVSFGEQTEQLESGKTNYQISGTVSKALTYSIDREGYSKFFRPKEGLSFLSNEYLDECMLYKQSAGLCRGLRAKGNAMIDNGNTQLTDKLQKISYYGRIPIHYNFYPHVVSFLENNIDNTPAKTDFGVMLHQAFDQSIAALRNAKPELGNLLTNIFNQDTIDEFYPHLLHKNSRLAILIEYADKIVDLMRRQYITEEHFQYLFNTFIEPTHPALSVILSEQSKESSELLSNNEEYSQHVASVLNFLPIVFGNGQGDVWAYHRQLAHSLSLRFFTLQQLGLISLKQSAAHSFPIQHLLSDQGFEIIKSTRITASQLAQVPNEAIFTLLESPFARHLWCDESFRNRFHEYFPSFSDDSENFTTYFANRPDNQRQPQGPISDNHITLVNLILLHLNPDLNEIFMRSNLPATADAITFIYPRLKDINAAWQKKLINTSKLNGLGADNLRILFDSHYGPRLLKHESFNQLFRIAVVNSANREHIDIIIQQLSTQYGITALENEIITSDLISKLIESNKLKAILPVITSPWGVKLLSSNNFVTASIHEGYITMEQFTRFDHKALAIILSDEGMKALKNGYLSLKEIHRLIPHKNRPDSKDHSTHPGLRYYLLNPNEQAVKLIKRVNHLSLSQQEILFDNLVNETNNGLFIPELYPSFKKQYWLKRLYYLTWEKHTKLEGNRNQTNELHIKYVPAAGGFVHYISYSRLSMATYYAILRYQEDVVASFENAYEDEELPDYLRDCFKGNERSHFMDSDRSHLVSRCQKVTPPKSRYWKSHCKAIDPLMVKLAMDKDEKWSEFYRLLRVLDATMYSELDPNIIGSKRFTYELTTAQNLLEELYKAYDVHKENIPRFQKVALAAIRKARPNLRHEHTLLTILANIVSFILGLGVGYLAACAYNGGTLFTRTQTYDLCPYIEKEVKALPRPSQ